MRSFHGLLLVAALFASLVSCTSSKTGSGIDAGGDAGEDAGHDGGDEDGGVDGGNGGPSGCPADACKPGGTCAADGDGYRCTCGEGFAGTGTQACTDVNECDQSSARCGHGGTCTNTAGGYTCTGCDAGYQSSGGGFPSCVDTNECMASPGLCTNDGTCTNTAGGYLCECPTGFVSTGGAFPTCTDVEECTLDAGICGNGGTCSEKLGGYVCTNCNAGYTPSTGDFPSCVDVNECTVDANVCENGGTCNNIAPGYECSACDAGYHSDNATFAKCVNVNECNLDPDVCGNGGTCEDTTPGYDCNDCDAGYESDTETFAKCIDIDECTRGTDDCTSLAQCDNTVGSFTCTCPANMVGGSGASECSPVLSSLAVSRGALTPSFDPATVSYTLALPAGVARYDLTAAVATPGNESIEVDGQAVASGEAVTVTTPLFTQGTTTVELSVADETTSYEVEATRATAALGADTVVSGAGLGVAIDISADGSTLVAGAHTEGPGAVYVFVRSAAGWAQQARLSPNAGSSSDQFGWVVKISADGNTVLVGAPLEDSSAADDETDNDAENSGASYVFTRSGTTWTQSAYLKAANLGADDNFGWAVALADDGNTLAVGARRESSDSSTINGPDNDLAFRAGAAYVFTRTANTWSQQAFIKAPNAEASNFFGYGCALSADGNRLVVGALGENSNVGGVLTDTTLASGSAANAGAAYVFDRTGAAWTFSAMLKAVTPAAGDFMGQVVSISGDADTIAVGVPRASSQQGNVAIFTLGQTGWAHQQTLSATNPGSGDRFGTSVSLSGDGNRLIAGAPLEDGSGRGIDPSDDDNTFDAGAVYAFTRSGANWSTPRYVKASDTLASDTEPGDQFGFAAAISADGSTMAAGSYNRDRGINRSGAVYVY